MNDNEFEATIIGASGFIGSNLLKYLQAKNIKCYAPSEDQLKEEVFNMKLGVVYFCIGVTKSKNIDVPRMIDAHVNILLKILKKAKYSFFIYFSSVNVYGELKNYGDTVLNEESTPRIDFSNANKNIYTASKILGEQLVLSDNKKQHLVIRLSNVFGLCEQSHGFLSEYLRLMNTAEEINLNSSENELRDYIYIDDVIFALNEIVEKRITGILNLVSGKTTSNKRLQQIFMEKKSFAINFNQACISLSDENSPRYSSEKLNALRIRLPRTIDDLI